MLIVTGAFGAGKTSIVSFLLDHTMGYFGWEEHDYSEYVEMRSRTRCKALEVIESILLAKQPDRESVKLHVIDNASFIQSTMTPEATLRLTQLMQSYKQGIRANKQCPHKVIVISESMSPAWLRVLRDKCSVGTLHLETSLSGYVRATCEFYDSLELCEGVPGRAILHNYARAGRSCVVDAGTSGLFSVARDLLQQKMDSYWQDWCATAVALDTRILEQIEWQCVARVYGLGNMLTLYSAMRWVDNVWRDDALVELAARGLRCVAITIDGPMARLESFSHSIGFQARRLARAERSRVLPWQDDDLARF